MSKKNWISRKDIKDSSLSSEEKEIELELFDKAEKERITELLDEPQKEDESQKKRVVVSTTVHSPVKKNPNFVSTSELNSEGKLKGRFWDKEKTLKKPTVVTGDVALSESEEGDLKRKKIIADRKKSKEKE